MPRIAALSLMALLLAACESQQAARQLAEETAVNTAQLSATLSQVAASERSTSLKRANTLAQYDRAVSESKAALAFDIAITKKSGDGDAVNLLNEIQKWLVEAERAAAVEGGSVAERRQKLLEGQQEINDKAKALAAIAKTLNQLARAEGSVARAAFLKSYFQEVFALLQASEEAANQAADGAESAADNIEAAEATLPQPSSGATSP